MKFPICAVLVVYTLSCAGAVPCIIEKCSDSAPCYSAPLPAVDCKPACFNPKLALFQKFPLLYRIYDKHCKLYCGKLKGITPCPSSPSPSPSCVTPAPAYVTPAPVCAASRPQDSALSPELLSALMALSAQPASSQAPAQSCACL